MNVEFPFFATLESPKWYLAERLKILGFENKEIDVFFAWCDNQNIDIDTFFEVDQKQLFFRYLNETK